MEREGSWVGQGRRNTGYHRPQAGGGGGGVEDPHRYHGPKRILGALTRSEAVAGMGSHDREEHPTALLLQEVLSDQPETKP